MLSIVEREYIDALKRYTVLLNIRIVLLKALQPVHMKRTAQGES